MGNFGKRLLIVLVSALAVVALALIGNAYQQAERVHKVSNASSEVYESNGISLTKKDIWNTILYSSPMSTVSEMVDEKLLGSVIEEVKAKGTSDAKYVSKRNTLVYGSDDEDTLNEMSSDEKTEKEEEFANKLIVMGKTEEDYIYLQLAYDAYATYRLTAGLQVGGKDYDLSDDTLKEEINGNTGDAYAIAIKFYSENDAATFVETYLNETSKLALVDDEIRYYVGNDLYLPAEDATLKADGTYDYETVTLSDGTTTVNVPNASVMTDDDGNYVYDETYQAFVCSTSTTLKGEDGETVATDADGNTIYAKYVLIKLNDSGDGWVYYTAYTNAWSTSTEGEGDDETTVTDYTVSETNPVKTDGDATITTDDSTMVTYDEASFTDSNTIGLSSDEFLSLYVEMYNKYYEYQGKSVDATVTYDMFTAKESDADKLNEMLVKYGYAVVEGEIRLYTGNEEYVVDYEKSENGEIVYKTATTSAGTETNIPNYKMKDGYFDSDDHLVYILDADGNRIPNDDKLAIEDVTSFTKNNTISVSQAELYGLYIALFGAEDDNYSKLVYNYDTVNTASSDLATQLFTTMTGADYLAYSTEVGSDYYMIYKLQAQVIDYTDEEMAEKIEELKQEKIEEYVSDSSFVDTCLADLRKEAGLKIYDEFLAYEYDSSIAYDSSDNTYGPSDTDGYYKEKSYSAKNLVKLNAKEVQVSDSQSYTGKITITADDLYDYCMSHCPESYIGTAYLNKYLLQMPEFETIHGKSASKVNYLTSKNWKMVEYADQTEQMNYYFEYYKSLYEQYGMTYTYSSIEQFLYAYGSRSFDDLVVLLERSTMRSVYLYNLLTGLDITDKDGNTISSTYTFTTDLAHQAFSSIAWNNIKDNYIDVNVNHLLVYLDADEDGTPDDYTSESDVKLVTGGKYADYTELLNALYDCLYSYIHDGANTALANADSSVLSDFVDAFNDASWADDASDDDKLYLSFKKYGVHLKYEELGEVTASSITSYVDEFQEGVKALETKLENGDNELLGYAVTDGFVTTSFGEHFIYAYAGDDFEMPSFKFEDPDNEYAPGMVNENDEISDSQLATYMLEYYYGLIYGTTDNPEENAGYAYPNLPTEITDKIDELYGDYLDTIMDESYTYMSTYTTLKKLENKGDYDFSKLAEVYRIAIFDED